MRSLIFIAFAALVAACSSGTPASVKVIDCGAKPAQNPTTSTPVSIGETGPSRDAVVVHPGDVVRFVTSELPIVPGHVSSDSSIVAPALAIASGTKCLQFAATGEYGFHASAFDGTVYVRSSLSETIFGILDFAGDQVGVPDPRARDAAGLAADLGRAPPERDDAGPARSQPRQHRPDQAEGHPALRRRRA